MHSSSREAALLKLAVMVPPTARLALALQYHIEHSEPVCAVPCPLVNSTALTQPFPALSVTLVTEFSSPSVVWLLSPPISRTPKSPAAIAVVAVVRVIDVLLS